MSSNNILIKDQLMLTASYSALEIAISVCTPSLETCVIQLTVNHTLAMYVAVEINLLLYRGKLWWVHTSAN